MTRKFSDGLLLSMLLFAASCIDPRSASAQYAAPPWSPPHTSPIPNAWRTRPSPSRLAPARSLRRPRSRTPLRGGDTADLILGDTQLLKLLADPMVSEDNRNDIEAEILGRTKEFLPLLFAYAASGEPKPLANVSERLLYVILTPKYRSPYARPIADEPALKVRVDNWRDFWVESRERKLSEIHSEMKRHIDRYWQTGETQVFRYSERVR